MKEGTSAAVRQGDAAGQAVVAERRRTPRRPVDAAVVLRLADAGNHGPVPARLVDLSAGGVGVRLQRPLAPGKQFTLEVPGVSTSGSTGGDGAGGNGGEAKALRYRVVRCKPLGHGAFHVGAAFVRTPVPTAARANAANSANTANRANAAAANAKAAATGTAKRA